ncbi:hypothetical protein ACW9IK_18595 [Pseudomonas gingeri]
MQYFSTDFPLKSGTHGADLLGECLNWVIDSPHTKISEEEIFSLREKEEFEYRKGYEFLEFDSAQDEKYKVLSFRYSKSDDKYLWATTVSFLLLNTTQEVWVGVKATCESKGAVAESPPVKKPVIVIRLIDRFGGGFDERLVINHSALILSDDEDGRDLAVTLISGVCNYRLPIVYVSCGYNGRHQVIPNRLARKLSGIAHVVVEPSREFSAKIRARVSSRNVYGGVIGVYWPHDGETTLYRYDRDWWTVKSFEEEIFSELSSVLSKRMPFQICTWGAVKDLKTRSAINKLTSEGADANELADLYRIDVDQKNDIIKGLHQEISRLESLVRGLQAKRPVQGGVMVNVGDEDDYFQDEIAGIVLDAVQEYSSRVPEGSRRQHVLQSILAHNEYERYSGVISREIKEALRGYREMNGKVRSALEKCGFEVASESKHWKIIYKGDERYSYVLPKSGSDNRGGLNAGSDICRIVF